MSTYPPASGGYQNQSSAIPATPAVVSAEKPKKPGRGVLIAGVVLMCLSVVGGIGGIAVGVALTGENKTVTFESGQLVELDTSVYEDPVLYIESTDSSPGSCSALDTNGDSVTMYERSYGAKTVDGTRWEPVFYFYTYSYKSPYTVYCESDTDGASFMLEAKDNGTVLGMTLVISLLGGFVVFIVGLVLTIVGGSRQSKAKREQRMAMYGPAFGAPSAYGAPGSAPPAGYGTPYGAQPGPAQPGPQAPGSAPYGTGYGTQGTGYGAQPGRQAPGGAGYGATPGAPGPVYGTPPATYTAGTPYGTAPQGPYQAPTGPAGGAPAPGQPGQWGAAPNGGGQNGAGQNGATTNGSGNGLPSLDPPAGPWVQPNSNGDTTS